MQPFIGLVIAGSVTLSIAGLATLCVMIETHNRRQARRELFGLSALSFP